MNIGFIDVDTIKNNSIIDQNIDDKLIEFSIDKAQEINILQVLGTELYNTLSTKILNNQISGYYQTLLDIYVSKALIEWSVYYLYTDSAYRFTNKSVVKRTNDNTANLDDSVIRDIKRHQKSIAEFYNNRLVEFLLNNQSQFPEWLSYSKIMGFIGQKTRKYTSTGIYLGRGLNVMSDRNLNKNRYTRGFNRNDGSTDKWV
jgi:ribosomal protein S17E